MTTPAFDRDEQLFVIGPRAGEHPQVETMVSMLQNACRYLLAVSRELGPEQLSAVPAGVVNSIGALLSYYWLHFLMDEARHGGQIILLRKHLLTGADAAFDPFALR